MANWNIKKKNGENVKFDDNSVRSNTEYKDADNQRNNGYNFFEQSYTTNRVVVDGVTVYEDQSIGNGQPGVINIHTPLDENIEERRKKDNRIINTLFILTFFFAPPMFILMLIFRMLGCLKAN